MSLLCVFYVSLTCFAVLSPASCGKFEVAHQWNYVNYTWPSAELIASFNYTPGEDIVDGVKIHEDVVYLALPRLKKSARVTLASLQLYAERENPLLSPYPSWAMNSGPSCDTLQNVLSMEIDRDGVMWVLDARRIDNNTECPPKIVLLDLKDGGRTVDSFVVPNELCPHRGGCFLNDIVVDGDHAYVSDTTDSDPGILVYRRTSKTAWKVRDRSMFGVPESVRFAAQGVENTQISHVNGIALCCGGEERSVYYMPQTSLHIFSISSAVLKAAATNVSGSVTDWGTKQGQSGGMICDTRDNIYYGVLPLDAVGRWNVNGSLAGAEIVEQNHDVIKWPASFSVYQGDLYVITNSISKFTRDGINNTEVNFRIIKTNVGAESYIQCEGRDQI